MKLQAILITLAIAQTVYGHGYLLHPLARQYSCYKAKDFYWPDDGSGINDEACRKAFQLVYNKYNKNSAQAQYMFDQFPEYAAMAGQDYNNHTHVRLNVVPHNLCAAGANDSAKAFGDKSGIDLNLDNWHTTVIPHSGSNQLYFCPTVIHEPSFFEVYITRQGYRYSDVLSWDDLELIYSKTSDLVQKPKKIECENEMVYALDVHLPPRKTKFILFVRWQREDVMGEGFYNCADAVYANKDEL